MSIQANPTPGARNVTSRIGQVQLLPIDEDSMTVAKNGHVIGAIEKRGRRWGHDKSADATFPSQTSAINALIRHWPGVSL